MSLIKLLEKIKAREDYTDLQMASLMGCSRQLFQMTRTGKIPPGNKILKGTITAFPELRDEVIYFLTKEDPR